MSFSAAGILFITKDGQALFLKRSQHGDYAGYWAFPGGTCENEETFAETAHREIREEIGSYPSLNKIIELCKSKTLINDSENLIYTTFICPVTNQFIPDLNEEHVGWAWAPAHDPPQPLHPGCQIAIDRFGMDELDVAHAIADGRLASPQIYENMLLIALRITGTGVSYRTAHEEYVYRAPQIYLNQHFLDRCAGLSVIWEHTTADMLNSKEYAERVIGAIMFAYVKDEDVWGIARIYDDEARNLLETHQLSTSPDVIFRGAGSGTKIDMPDGEVLLIEGEPVLIDHLAICGIRENEDGEIEAIPGVWDCMKPPSGVQLDIAKQDSQSSEDKIFYIKKLTDELIRRLVRS